MDRGEQGEAAGSDAEISRREIVAEALRKVRDKLNSEQLPSHSTIADLVQLLKLHKDLGLEDELPHEIKILWQEIDDDASCES